MRLDVYTDIANGANMVEYWHWHSIHAGQETYWKGVLGHDLEPNRAYAEVSRTAHELQRVGPRLVNLAIRNEVAILYSVDSSNGISFMPYTNGAGGYSATLQQLHQCLYKSNIGVDFVFPSTADFSPYKLLIVPSLYVADDALLKRISEYVRGGGHVLMTFKSGFTNENSAVRWEKAPGPLREAAGFSYQEFSNLEQPLALRGDPLHVGESNRVSQWAEFLDVTTAKPLATYDHPFFGQWPAITENHFGRGTLLYEGTAASDGLQQAIVQRALEASGIAFDPDASHSTVRVRQGINGQGRTVTYLFNYSSTATTARYGGPSGHDILTGKAVSAGEKLDISPWDLAIVESDR
jgi:beta-galactosidase